jgi:hypothetical protein
MPTANTSVEAAAIEAAYQARVGTLYALLATSLGDSPGAEKQAVDRFTTGLNIAKRARQLALSVTGAEVAAIAAQPRRKKIAKA